MAHEMPANITDGESMIRNWRSRQQLAVREWNRAHQNAAYVDVLVEGDPDTLVQSARTHARVDPQMGAVVAVAYNNVSGERLVPLSKISVVEEG